MSAFLHLLICMIAIALALLLCHPELVKGKHCCKHRPSFFTFTICLSFLPFALMQKAEPKNGGKPKPRRASFHLRRSAVITAYIIALLRSKQHASLLHATFSKGHTIPLNVTNDRCCIPLSFS
jgi:hypothetical protein